MMSMDWAIMLIQQQQKTPTLSTTHYEEVCKEVLGTKAY